MKPTTQIISLDYSGLAKDTIIAKNAAESYGWDARVTLRRPLSIPQRVAQRLRLHRLQKRTLDLNIFMQQPEGWWLPQARKSVVIPNADWFTEYGIRLLPEVDEVWCKTHDAVAVFRNLGAHAKYLGFTSSNPTLGTGLPPDRNWREALHIAGSSALKGTSQLIEAWSRNPKWPLLTLVTSIEELGRKASRVPNICTRSGRLSDHDIATLQFRCGIHIQPSEVEGYGHILGESLAAGAVLVTTDAPPMNELVDDSRGFLVRSRPTTMHHLAMRHEILEHDFDSVMNGIWEMPVDMLESKGRNATRWHLDNKQQFHGRFRELLQSSR